MAPCHRLVPLQFFVREGAGGREYKVHTLHLIGWSPITGTAGTQLPANFFALGRVVKRGKEKPRRSGVCVRGYAYLYFIGEQR